MRVFLLLILALIVVALALAPPLDLDEGGPDRAAALSGFDGASVPPPSAGTATASATVSATLSAPLSARPCASVGCAPPREASPAASRRGM